MSTASDLRKCLLCGRRQTVIGAWEPNQPTAFEMGFTSGKKAVVLYALCSKHARKAQALSSRIEDTLIEQSRPGVTDRSKDIAVFLPTTTF